jgi:prevent-host-death family protein
MSPTTTYEVSMTDAPARLAELVGLAEQGAEIVIVKDGQPVARLVPAGSAGRPRIAGLDEGKAWMSDDFNLLIAQAVVENLTLVSSDGIFARNPVSVLW